MPTLKGIRKLCSDILNKLSRVVYDPNPDRTHEIHEIGISKNSKSSKRALVIYSINYINFIMRREGANFPYLAFHSMWRETWEMVDSLIANGYIVDYFDVYSPHNIEWSKYKLIIDERNNLANSPKISGQIKLSYLTGNHWNYHNNSEILRITQFYNRNGFIISPKRQVAPNFSDLFADYLTYFGSGNQLSGYSQKPLLHQLNISSYVPPFFKKNISACRNNFLWMGSGGLIHKGLDLAIESFTDIEGANLFIACNMENDPQFHLWTKGIFKKYKNIQYVGWLDVSSDYFSNIASQCIGIISPSCSEGGAGATIQAMQFGLIPITTKDTNLRGSDLGITIDSTNDLEIIKKIIESVNEIRSLSDHELKSKSDAVREFASNNFTIEKYRESFDALLEKFTD